MIRRAREGLGSRLVYWAADLESAALVDYLVAPPDSTLEALANFRLAWAGLVEAVGVALVGE